MNNYPTKSKSPEEEELAAKKAELDKLSDLLAEKELELVNLKLKVTRIKNRYFNEVGRKYVELDELLAQIAELRFKKDLSNEEARDVAFKAKQRAKESAKEYEKFEKPSQSQTNKTEVSKEIKKLYRRIASIIHPDKSTDEKGREIRTRLMANLNEAYAAGNINKMKDILDEWESSPDAITGDGIAVDLVRVIRTIAQVKRRLSKIEEDIQEIIASDDYQLMLDVHEADAKGKDILKDLAASIDIRIQRAREQFSVLQKH